MANTKQANKRAIQSERRRQHNASQRSAFRTALKNVVNAIAKGNRTLAEEAYRKAVPIIDKMVTKGLIHKNKASRHKSRLNTHIKCMEETTIT